ncbi:hypothetical protein BC938DRAFT_474960 [Jimgerdemannia flammicorona]|uniref:Quinon protein alcohol dehydrogenase-like superfamily n=1 Tax=Jimgerdemannia flammicorona TaxID=994334 RepID=A0A433Q167_9FUNG|nr:hypothetical protein BC938DRAFT_474960 [Jimgerdemannia flammicorona]
MNQEGVITYLLGGRQQGLGDSDCWLRTLIGVLAIVISHDLVFVAGAGKLVALDIANGTEKWRNELPSMGYDAVSILASVDPPAVPGQADGFGSYSAAPAYSEYPAPFLSSTTVTSSSVILVSTFGKVMGINRNNGLASGYGLPSALFDVANPNNAFVGCGSRLYYLELVTGRCVWEQSLTNSMLGCGYLSMVDYASSIRAAYAYTSPDSNPQANWDKEEERRRRSHGN